MWSRHDLCGHGHSAQAAAAEWAHHDVSPILSLEAQEQAGEIFYQTKYLLVVTCEVYWSAGVGVRELPQEIRQAEPRYPEAFLIYIQLYLTEVVLTLQSIIGQFLVAWTGQPLSSSCSLDVINNVWVCECCFRRVSNVPDLSTPIEMFCLTQLFRLAML